MRANDAWPQSRPAEIQSRGADEHIAQSLVQLRISIELLSIAVPRTWGSRDYRAYVIGADGHITGRFDLQCADDAVARARAELLANDEVIELWQGFSRLARFEPRRRTPRTDEAAPHHPLGTFLAPALET